MFRFVSWPVVAALGLISSAIVADEPVPADTVTENASPANIGVQVFIDEQTGAIRSPTDAETAEIAEQFRRKYIDLSVEHPVVYNEDGSLSKQLGSQYQMYSVARISDDGELETVCLPAEQAAEFLADKQDAGPAADVKADEERSK